jgi:hypothetical protein
MAYAYDENRHISQIMIQKIKGQGYDTIKYPLLEHASL